MARVKIESNPYNQEISYSKWNEGKKEWIQLDYEEDDKSRLLSNTLVKGFFPFHVKEIVDEIITEYKDDKGKIRILFEGTDDEFAELLSLCEEGDYSKLVDVKRSDRRLANARDILPSITQIFADHLSPLIKKSIDEEKIDDEMRKFSDASKDTIPICILGNYSAGKSTFINALIGNEILPSGDEPITAKVYQIHRATEPDMASVEFEYESEKFKITFKKKNNEIVFTGDDKPLYGMIKEKLDNLGKADITTRVHEALEIINDFDKNDTPDSISNLISICVPFVGGLWDKANRDFVIFDTPGSNSASNDKHLQVLKEQMHNLSNGLPIFVSEYDSLDSTDNERLYRVIREVKELDSRFTMIIVNKADAARIPKNGFEEAEIEQILSMAVPKNLYTEGIYFVSSIVGLGSKNKAKFIDDHIAEIFDGEEKKYSDPKSKFYKELYKNNIMPEQLKRHAIEQAQARKDRLYTNSGLFSIENEILTFAEKYSHYNKCKQAYLFLDKVIDQTSVEIEKNKQEREMQRNEVVAAFEKDKRDLIGKIEQHASDLENEGKVRYSVYMEPRIEEAEVIYTKEQLEELENDFISKQKEQRNFDERREEVIKARNNISSNLKENFGKIIKEKSIDAIKELSSDLVDDLGTLTQHSDALNTTKHDVDKAASDELLSKVKSDFTTHINDAQSRLEEESTAFWQERSAEIRKELIEVVTGSTVLNDDKKAEITDLILSYEDINLDNIAENTFVRDDLEKGVWIGKFKIISSDRLNISKLVEKYNATMVEIVNDIGNTISTIHELNLDTWVSSLLDRIRVNVVEYNADLQEQEKNIKAISKKIKELEKQQADLKKYTAQIKSMLDWSNA